MQSGPYTTLIETAELAAHLDDPQWAIIDCRFSLNDTTLGRRQYLDAHIPSAVYADLDVDLSGPVTKGETGRHPLPDVNVFAAKLGSWGIDERVQVVAYDGAGGMVAGRLWWMLKWLGHEKVAVLNGDFRAWLHEERPTVSGEESRTPRTFTPRPQPERLVGASEVLAHLCDPKVSLLDARAHDRFRGENETLDAKAGHIPGAKSVPYSENLDAQGRFLSPQHLAERFQDLLGDVPAEQAVLYCGSGVSAAHNALAMAHAGLGTPRLYVGSWSDWITDPARPVATGDEA
ncbi:MAG: sulfurtransferase [Caldilineaceae bacterium]|nr:sulfurtransferase [Caldilineaceae bacterium]